MLTGEAKRNYQREYMRDYMRKRRAEEYALQRAGLNAGSKQGLNETTHTFEPLNFVDMQYDGEGNLIPEY